MALCKMEGCFFFFLLFDFTPSSLSSCFWHIKLPQLSLHLSWWLHSQEGGGLGGGERVHHSAFYNTPLSEQSPPFCSTPASEVTSDLPLPGATSLLMNRLNVIRLPAKIRTQAQSCSLKLLFFIKDSGHSGSHVSESETALVSVRGPVC